MATHNHREQRRHAVAAGSPEPILYDDCERCDEHAKSVFYSLDHTFMAALWGRMIHVEREHGSYLSGNEATACKRLYEVAVWMEHYTEINPWKLEVGEAVLL